MIRKLRQNVQLPEPIVGCIWIPLTQGQFALIDEIDKDLASFNWRAQGHKTSKTYYVLRSIKDGDRYRYISMHRVIGERMGISAEVDHHDLDGRNNRRNNLRDASHSQNGANVGKKKNNKTGYIGVSHKTDIFYQASAYINGKSTGLGVKFTDLVEAAHVYDRAVLKDRGQFAKLNFPALKLILDSNHSS